MGMVLVSEPHYSSTREGIRHTRNAVIDDVWTLHGVLWNGSVNQGAEGHRYARYIGAGALRYGLGSLVRYKLRVWTAVDADVTQVLVSPYIVSLET